MCTRKPEVELINGITDSTEMLTEGLTWFPSPLAPQQGQLDVVHACALSGPRPALWLQLCVVSGLCVSVGTLNAPYSEACMGVQDCPPPLSRPLQRAVSLFKAKGRRGEGGENKRPLLLFLSACVPSAPLHCHTSLFSLFSLLYPTQLSLPSRSICFPSFFTL